MIDQNGFVVAKSQRVVDKRATNLERELKHVDYFTYEEWLAVPAGSVFIYDTECYPNYWLIAFKCIKTNKVVAFEHSPDRALDIESIQWMLWRYCFVGFRSNTYDLPMITLALKGASTAELKAANDFLIRDDGMVVTTYDFEKEFKVKCQKINTIDLFDVAPLDGSLKLYAGRIHVERLQDLPFNPSYHLTKEEAEMVKSYCIGGDLDATHALYNELIQQIKLREQMSVEYGVDLRSKSDAQVAEAVINAELQKVTGTYPKKPFVKEDLELKYNVPDYIKFKHHELQDALELIRLATFKLDSLGSPMWPVGLGRLEKAKNGNAKWLLDVTINGNVYKLGMGGLHSQEKSVAHISDADTIIADNDVESFYPRIIINQRLFPSHLGESFLSVYEAIVNRRIQAKRDGNKVVADSLKITINGSFGKLGNKWSTLFAPQLMLQVTITGQLSLLMLIEMLEDVGIKCVSGNTDGVVSKYHKSMHKVCRDVIAEWERITNFKTEETRYGGTYSRDVNSYIATKLKQDKKTKEWTTEIEECKTKGCYSERGSALNSVLSKNPETLICSDALQAFIAKGADIETTIRKCRDIRRFVSLKNVRGGGEKGGKYLGKVVRWYYAKNEAGFIAYAGSGNKVGKTDGARPLMDLPKEFPDNINYDWYIKETIDMLYDIGLRKKPTTAKLFF